MAPNKSPTLKLEQNTSTGDRIDAPAARRHTAVAEAQFCASATAQYWASVCTNGARHGTGHGWERLLGVSHCGGAHTWSVSSPIDAQRSHRGSSELMNLQSNRARFTCAALPTSYHSTGVLSPASNDCCSAAPAAAQQGLVCTTSCYAVRSPFRRHLQSLTLKNMTFSDRRVGL